MLNVQTEVEAEDLDVSMARSMKPRNRRIGVFWARHLMTEAVSMHFNTTIFMLTITGNSRAILTDSFRTTSLGCG